MATLVDGNYLNQYVAPQLLVEFRNYKDDFLAVIPGAPKQAITADGIRFNKLINNVGFLVNNSTGFTATSMPGKKGLVEWEKYDTEPTKVDDAEIRALPFDKRASVRVKHSEAFKIGYRDHAMWKLAPGDDTSDDMPVMRTTGADDGSGRLRLIFADIIEYLGKVKKLNLPNEREFYVILCAEHQIDLMLDRDSTAYFVDKNIIFDPETGKVKSVMGFKFFTNNSAVAYDNLGVKKAMGSAMISTDRYASVFFYAPNTVKHIDKVKILYKPETTDTESADPTSEFRLQAYGLIDRIQEYAVGAIISGIAE